MLESSLEVLSEILGPVRTIAPIPVNDLQDLSGRLPDTLLSYLRTHGTMLHAGGLLHLCNPRKYDSLLPIIFADDSELAPDALCIYGFTAFAKVYVWHKRYGGIEVDLVTGWVTASGMLAPEALSTPAIELETRLAGFDASFADIKGSDRRPLYARAVAALGEPGIDECFGFVPAFILGGPLQLANIRRYSALEHFAFLSQIAKPVIMDFSTLPPRPIRQLGGP